MIVALVLCHSQIQLLFPEVCTAVGQFPSFLMTLCALVMSPTSSGVSTVNLEYTTVSHLKQLGLFVEVCNTELSVSV